MSIATQNPEKQAKADRGIGRIFQSLHDRDFLFLWLGSLGSFMAMNMQMVASGYLAFQLSGTATALGIVTVSSGFPQLFLALIGGVVADRVPKRNLIMIVQSLMALLAVIYVFLIMTQQIQIWHMVIGGIIQGGLFAFNMPARQALVPSIVGRENLANAVALNNAGMNLTRIVGPSLAGVLIGLSQVGIAGAYMAMACCYVVALVMLIQLPSEKPTARAHKSTMISEVKDGLSYIRSSATLVTLLGMAFAVVVLAMPYQTLMPLFALSVHDVGASGLGMLGGVTGAGALMGSLFVAYLSQSPRKEALQIAAGLAFGTFLVVFALAPSFATALMAIFFVGAAGNIYMALNNTLIMTSTDPTMYGRVMSVYMMTFSLMPLSSFPMSILADSIGVQPTLAGAGVLTALCVGALTLFARNAAVRQQVRVSPNEGATPYARPAGGE